MGWVFEMMPNVTRGDRMAGLVTYLAGPGRHNEHEDQHVVAGDPAVMAWHADSTLDASASRDLAQHLERPHRAFGTDVSGGHVWHCSLSLRAEEGALTDEKWSAIAQDFLKLMDLDDADGTKAPLRWAAVRHGASSAGNDHIHLVVNLVREDGTKASTHNDFRRAQQAARHLETKYGLEELESVQADRSTRGYDPAERPAAARRVAMAKYQRANADGPRWTMLPETDRTRLIRAELAADEPRYALARTVRGCATASQDEAEFVRRMRGAGLLVRPRFAHGSDQVITGYSAARRPVAGERPIWYGGGHLGRDLTLPRLRGEWPDRPETATSAAAEWNAAYRGRRVVAVGRESLEPDVDTLRTINEQLGQLRDQLRQIPIEDRDTWASVARHAAGTFASWSRATESVPGHLARAADVLSYSAQTHRMDRRRPRVDTTPLRGAARVILSTARGGQGIAAQMILMRQLANLAKAVHDASGAAEQYRQAEKIRRVEAENLRAVHARLEALAPASTNTPPPAASQAPTLAPSTGSPLPSRLGERAHMPATPSQDQSRGR